MAQKTALEPFLAHLKTLDSNARLLSFLDDTYIMIKKPLALLALTGLQQAVAPLGLALNPRKTLVFSPNGQQELPAELLCHWVTSLPVLGAHLRAPGDNQDAPLQLGGDSDGLEQATTRLGKLWKELQRLHKAGLTQQATASLLRSYAGAASQYPLQLEQATNNSVQQYDDTLLACWQELADRPLTEEARARLGLPTRLGGCGVQFAATRQHAAYWASWLAVVSEVSAELGHASVADFVDALPNLAAQLAQARDGLAAQGMVLSDGAALSEALRSPYPQRLLVGRVQKKNRTALLQSLPHPKPAEARGAGGPGAAGFLQYPSDANCSMEDVFWRAALRQRLGMSRAELSQQELAAPAASCCLQRVGAGTTCGAPLDDRGFHALTDQVGGGVLLRHNRVAKAVGGLLQRWRGATPLFEQRVPTWDRLRRREEGNTDPQDQVERAILDVEYASEEGRRWIDVTVRHPAAGDNAAVRAACRRDGEATRRAERSKHQRYPGPQLTAFALEAPGRVGAEAKAWLLNEVRQLPPDTQTKELARAYRVVSCALQTEVVRQLRKAAGLR